MNAWQLKFAKLLKNADFILVANPQMPNMIHTPGLVCFSKLVKPGVSFRFHVYPSDEAETVFVRKKGNAVEKVGSERNVNCPEEIADVLKTWERQLREIDILCNKCRNGEYVMERNGKPIQVVCNRCNGKGWQNYNDRRANERYDFVMRQRKAPLHWHPY